MKIIIIIAALLLSSPGFAATAIIVNSANGAEVSMRDVKKIFLGKIGSFSDGNNAIPMTLSEGDDTRTRFNSEVLGKNEGQYIAYWSKMVFTGNGVPPQEVSSMEELKAEVSKNPSTIGFIDESLVDDSVRVIGTF